MEDRRIGLHRFEGVVHRRQVFVLHVDQQQRLFGYVQGFSGHGGHLLADEDHPVPGKHREVPQPAAHPAVRDILPRYDGVDTGQRPGLGCVDADYPGVGEGASEDLAPKHPRQQHIRCVASFAGNLVGAFTPGHRLADGGEGSNHGNLLEGSCAPQYSTGPWRSAIA